MFDLPSEAARLLIALGFCRSELRFRTAFRSRRCRAGTRVQRWSSFPSSAYASTAWRLLAAVVRRAMWLLVGGSGGCRIAAGFWCRKLSPGAVATGCGTEQGRADYVLAPNTRVP